MSSEAAAIDDAEKTARRARLWGWLAPDRQMLCLLAITVAAGFLRFWRLGQQSFWVDEAHVVERSCSTWDHIFFALRDQAFPPGWYIAMWEWIRAMTWWRGSALQAYDPQALRALPAALGTLMPLAMYFLARAITDRKGALLVALLTAVNPYLIYYSRDLKMYMALWLFVALHMGLFLRWMQSPRHWLWWPLWIISGLVMVSLHSLGWIVVGVELLWLITRPRIRALDAPLWMLGAGIMGMVPGWWYMYRSVWMKKFEATGVPPGVGWVAQYTKMDWNALASLPSAHLLGYLVPRDQPDQQTMGWFGRLLYIWRQRTTHDPLDQQTMGWFGLGDDFSNHLATRTLPWLATWETRCILILACLAVLGMIPWRGIRRSEEREKSITAGRWWWVLVWIALPVLAVGVGSLDKPGLQLQWPWLAAWLGHWGKWIVTPAALGWLGIGVWRARYWGVKKTTWWMVVVAAITGMGWALVRGVTLSWPPHDIIWEPRYLGVICPAFILALAALLRRLPTWPVRALAISFVICVSVASALSNYLVYRQDPWNRVAQIAVEYYQKDKPRALAVGYPAPRWGIVPVTYTMLHALEILPNPENNTTAIQEWMDGRNLRSANDDLRFLQRAQNDVRVQTIVLTDKEGDLTDGPLSNAALEKTLAGWKQIREEHYRMYYEWHYYFFANWRTRVWTRIPGYVPPATAMAPATRK